MADGEKHSQAMAFVNALQGILDSLTKTAASEELHEPEIEVEENINYENTYEFFISTFSRKSLSSLMICITLVCAMHHSDTDSES